MQQNAFAQQCTDTMALSKHYKHSRAPTSTLVKIKNRSLIPAPSRENQGRKRRGARVPFAIVCWTVLVLLSCKLREGVHLHGKVSELEETTNSFAGEMERNEVWDLALRSMVLSGKEKSNHNSASLVAFAPFSQ